MFSTNKSFFSLLLPKTSYTRFQTNSYKGTLKIYMKCQIIKKYKWSKICVSNNSIIILSFYTRREMEEKTFLKFYNDLFQKNFLRHLKFLNQVQRPISVFLNQGAAAQYCAIEYF